MLQHPVCFNLIMTMVVQTVLSRAACFKFNEHSSTSMALYDISPMVIHRTVLKYLVPLNTLSYLGVAKCICLSCRSPDGMCILTNSDDNCLRIYNTPEQLYTGDTTNIPEMVRMKCTFLTLSILEVYAVVVN